MSYLAWEDFSTKKTTAQKATEAIACYKERFGELPSIVLVPEGTGEMKGFAFPYREDRLVHPNQVYVGHDDRKAGNDDDKIPAVA